MILFFSKRPRLFRFGVAIAGMLALATVARALEPATPLGRLGRQAWTMENGLPQNSVSALLQSRSGFLWAGTELGLARFDGIGFRIFDRTTAPFPDAEVRCMADTADGSLWVGTSDGLARWKDGRISVFTAPDGLPSSSIRGLVDAGREGIWVWTESGLTLAHTNESHEVRFEALPANAGSPRGAITSIAANSAGSLWVGTTSGAALFRDGQWQTNWNTLSGANKLPAAPALVVRAENGDVLIAQGNGLMVDHGGSLTSIATQATVPANEVNFLARMADGTVAVTSKSTVLLLPPVVGTGGHGATHFDVTKQLPGSRIESVFADRQGCLWVGTNHGLARIAPAQGGFAVQQMPPTDPLAVNSVVSFLEDREGDLWVGTETGGLHILRDARFRIVGSSDGLSSDATTAVVQDVKGDLWIGTRDSGLNRISDGKTSLFTTVNGLQSNVILALDAAPDGSLWAGTPDGLNRIEGGRVTSFTSADGLPDDFIRSLLVAPDDSVWIGTRRGLTHLDHGKMRTYTEADGLGSDLVGALALARNGDLWIATLNGLTRLHQGKLHNFTRADGLSSNVITALDVTTSGTLWIGTQSDGLNLWDGTRFTAVPGKTTGGSQRIPAAIHALLDDRLGHLWLASDRGLARADEQMLRDCAEGKRCSLDGSYLVSFTTADGLRSRETSSNSHPTALRDRDGQLWFTTPRGVVAVDPRHFAPLPGPPPVAIERFAVDDAEAEQPGSRIAAGHLRFQFDYAGLSFAAPQKLRYQYMLEGFDHAWTDAGTRRTAYYTNIPPGPYRFRVRAAIGDAPFSDEATGASEASLAFQLLPHFYQTLWFRILLVLLGVALVVVIFRRRVLRVEREFRAVMAERNRIAREIHDTLAQGYVGISLQLEVLGQLLQLNRVDAAAKHLTATQGLVRDGLNDARQSIWALRSQDSEEQTLPIRLQRLVEETDKDNSLAATFKVYGAFRALTPEAEQEVLRIAQEAIQNVKKHAAATEVSVQLVYNDRELALTVADNGKGFELKEKRADGHYGLTGMQERTAILHGNIEIESSVGSGTTVRLTVPAPEARKQQQEAT
jgi:ligand-binding sensor domain-containing protein/signal transduction histidine kinase